jgi:hypothetical protein
LKKAKTEMKRIISKMINLAWQCTHVIPAPRRLMQEDHEFEASLGYVIYETLSPKKEKKNQNDP